MESATAPSVSTPLYGARTPSPPPASSSRAGPHTRTVSAVSMLSASVTIASALSSETPSTTELSRASTAHQRGAAPAMLNPLRTTSTLRPVAGRAGFSSSRSNPRALRLSP